MREHHHRQRQRRDRDVAGGARPPARHRGQREQDHDRRAEPPRRRQRELARLLRGIKCKVNIIPWNPHPEAAYQRPADAVIDAFQAECKRAGLPTYLRTPRGDDIDAACGQLAGDVKDRTRVGERVARQRTVMLKQETYP